MGIMRMHDHQKLLPVLEHGVDVLGDTEIPLVREIKAPKSDPLPTFLSAEIWEIVSASAFEFILVCSRL